MGTFESGKSSTGNIILGRDAFDEVSGPNECRRQDGRVQGKTITVVDTPDIVPFSFTEQKAEMEKSLSMAPPGPHAFLLVIDKNQMMSYATRDFINELKENFGDEILEFTIFLFTHGVLRPDLAEFLLRMDGELRSLISSCGGRYHILNTEETEDQGEVTELLKKIEDLVERLLRMDGELQSLISSYGGRYHILNTEETEDQGQVTELLKKIEGMMEKNGGQYYTNEM
ncbi:GTPase IMAP family member 6-like [Chanos chanos]|uniref:GTPase IMAP family member 6-like n=1 Tax=Chanos chanos TaxID=29144 RepID=A0A6J2VRW3_CHACN|nr:GTPase IMAP family member 6-like [Chanos chanos]